MAGKHRKRWTRGSLSQGYDVSELFDVEHAGKEKGREGGEGGRGTLLRSLTVLSTYSSMRGICFSSHSTCFSLSSASSSVAKARHI
jgi:hypothetical protein